MKSVLLLGLVFLCSVLAVYGLSEGEDFVSRVDKNNDGKLSKEELRADICRECDIVVEQTLKADKNGIYI